MSTTALESFKARLDDFRGAARRMVRDASVFGRWFLEAAFGIWGLVIDAILGFVPESEEDRATIRRLTGRTKCPTSLASLVLIIAGGARLCVPATPAVAADAPDDRNNSCVMLLNRDIQCRPPHSSCQLDVCRTGLFGFVLQRPCEGTLAVHRNSPYVAPVRSV
jgi:hypothetical protein